MFWWAKYAAGVGAGIASAIHRFGRCGGAVALLVAVVAAGCGGRSKSAAEPPPPPPPRVLVVAPVLNLSGSRDFDPLKVTDLVASEFLSYDNVTVVPVNLALAELARRGQSAIETPQDAAELAQALGADATIVTAVTEYSPYEPPVIGLTMQWYAAAPAGLSETPHPGPRWQLQRVFNAADEQVQREIRDFAARRDGSAGPYGWRRYLRTQEGYVRYASWSLIGPMLQRDRMAERPSGEAQS